MNVKNFEFKAKVSETESYEKSLLDLNPRFVGTDHQVDTYFNVSKGRLKLREGNIENALINYDRSNSAEAKLSEVMLYKHQANPALKSILTHQLGVKVVVDKNRKIYFLENVKFHFDEVQGLGAFLEVEAIDEGAKFSIDELKDQCEHFRKFFNLPESALQSQSYSDMLLEKVAN